MRSVPLDRQRSVEHHQAPTVAPVVATDLSALASSCALITTPRLDAGCLSEWPRIQLGRSRSDVHGSRLQFRKTERTGARNPSPGGSEGRTGGSPHRGQRSILPQPSHNGDKRGRANAEAATY